MKQRLQVHFRLTLRQRNHCLASGHGMPCPDISISTAAWHAVPRQLRCGAACRVLTALRQRGIGAIRHRSNHEAIPSCRFRVRQHAAASASRARALTARQRVACIVETTHIVPPDLMRSYHGTLDRPMRAGRRRSLANGADGERTSVDCASCSTRFDMTVARWAQAATPNQQRNRDTNP